MKRYYTLFCVLAIVGSSLGQGMKKGLNYPFKIQEFIKSDCVTWYGWDLSLCKIQDRGIYDFMKEKYIPSWIQRLNKEISLNEVKRDLGKPCFLVDLLSIQNLYKEKKSKDFITHEYYEIPMDSIRKHVKNYQLPQSSGTGFTIIVESLNKPERFVTGYVTFFNIQSRELLWVIKMMGLPGGKHGFVEFYGNGIVELYVYFFGDYYKQTIKSLRK